MTQIAFRVDSEVADYLSALSKSNRDNSVNLTAKKLIQWCMFNDINPSDNRSCFDGEDRKMIEHIHLAIPHLMMSSGLGTQASIDAFDDSKKKKMAEIALDNLNKKCGDFQNIAYKTVQVTHNSFGLKQATQPDETTDWRSK